MIPRKNQQFTEKELHSEFGVQYIAGIRKSIKNKIIILINSYQQESKKGYNNMIDETAGFVTYTGHGQDDQTMTRHNKSILESKNEGYTMLYFDKPEPNRLIFRFPVEYHSHSFEEKKNIVGLMRQVILFKLRILDTK